MKKRVFTVFLVVFGVLFLTGMFAQGFTGPMGAANPSQVQTVTVAQTRNLPDDSLIKLTGNIVQSVSRDKYLFRDASGDITIKINRDLWTLTGLSIGAADRIEIGGKFDVKKRGVEVKVETMRKL